MTVPVTADEGWDGSCRLSHRVQTAASAMYIVAEEAEANRGTEASFMVDGLFAWVHALKGCDPMRWVEQAGQLHQPKRAVVAPTGGGMRRESLCSAASALFASCARPDWLRFLLCLGFVSCAAAPSRAID